MTGQGIRLRFYWKNHDREKGFQWREPQNLVNLVRFLYTNIQTQGRERRDVMDPFTCCKLEIFIPETHLRALQKALQDVDAGHIGNYDSCMSYSPVTGCWRPLEGSSPFIGTCGSISAEPELKAEVTCRTERLKETLAAIRKVHPYEEPVINVIPLYMTGMDAERG